MSDRRSNWNQNKRNFGGFRGGGNRGGRGRDGNLSHWRGPRNSRGNYGNNNGSGGYRGRDRQNNYGNRGGNQTWNRPKRDTPGKRLTEEQIGVTEYINTHEGFLGIIKSRYSDFQVSEINEQGEIAKLTNLSPPEAPQEKSVDEDEDLLFNKYNLEILPMETWDKINALAVSEDSAEKVEVDVSGMTKEQRTRIHDAVKKAFGDSIVGSTVTEDEKKLVRFEKYRKGVRIDNRVKWMWPGEYTYFVVYKENCDTMDAAVRIAERLRLNIRPSMLGYAGTKDRRGKTSQWFSLRKVDPRKVASALRGVRDLLVGNYSFSNKCLKLGMLKGNRFRIALRNVTVADSVVSEACELLQARGFLNYYGLQRFGTRADTPTYHIGIKILQGDFKAAIDKVLEEREGPLQDALRVYNTSGAAAALRVCPARVRQHNIELRLLRALANNPNDLLGALNKMARNTRLLYLHSYQSLVWNRALSERVRRLGLRPAVGDLVPTDTILEQEEVREDESDGEDTEGETDAEANETQDGVDAENKMADASTVTALETSTKECHQQKVQVKVLTQEDIDSNKYTIFDIVLPLPGNQIEYPPNMKDYYEELLAKDGLTLEMKHKIKSYTLMGAYRPCVMRPADVRWSCVRYSDPAADLVPSDRDELEGQVQRVTDTHLPDGKYKALILNLTLPSSCYATMALRELLKVDTSGDNQALQNNYHKKTEVKTEDSESKAEATENKDEDTTVEDSAEEKTGEKRKLETDEPEDVKKLKTEDQ